MSDLSWELSSRFDFQVWDGARGMATDEDKSKARWLSTRESIEAVIPDR